MMSEVKRNYSSTLRDAQARQTRRAIVDAGARLFVDDGFGRTTIDTIAAEAGVSRKTVFTSVGGKVEILKLAIDWAIVGDDEPVALADRPEIERLKAETDPRAILDGSTSARRSLLAPPGMDRHALEVDVAMPAGRPMTSGRLRGHSARSRAQWRTDMKGNEQAWLRS